MATSFGVVVGLGNCSLDRSLSFSSGGFLKPSLALRNPLSTTQVRAASNGEFTCQVAEEDVLETFLRERQLNGDFVARLSDMFWEREARKVIAPLSPPTSLRRHQVVEDGGDHEGGFLKLSRTHDWLSGAHDSAPRNKKPAAKIKRELWVLSIGIGAACTGYCLVVLSVQAAVSYATGVVFSCAYLELLCRHVDKLCSERVPRVFRPKKTASKKIGIRSEDVADAVERSIKGSGIALSSPRLVIPAAIYGLWMACHHHQHVSDGTFFDFQIVPAMFGMFVYKAAALVQLYRDNQDLHFVFPQNHDHDA